jgi:hypothetical protein
MKRTINLFLILSILIAVGCATKQTTSTVTYPDGSTVVVTNTVKVVDPIKLNKVAQTLQPLLSTVITRAIRNSPEHSAQIANYVRALGTAFYYVRSSQRFSPAEVLSAVDGATAGLQANVPQDIIDAKNAALSLYNVLLDDKLTVEVPANGWPMAIVNAFYNAIDIGLKDAGQNGILN